MNIYVLHNQNSTSILIALRIAMHIAQIFEKKIINVWHYMYCALLGLHLHLINWLSICRGRPNLLGYKVTTHNKCQSYSLKARKSAN